MGILVLTVRNRFYNLCQNPSVSNSATWEVHGSSVYQPYYHHSVKKKCDLPSGGVLVRCRGTDATPPQPYLVPSCQLLLNTLCVPPVIAEEESGVGAVSQSDISGIPTGHVVAVRVNNVRRKRLFDRPRREFSLTKSSGRRTFQLGNMQMYSHACRHFHLQCNKSSDGILAFFLSIRKPAPTLKAVTPPTKNQPYLTKACVWETSEILIIIL